MSIYKHHSSHAIGGPVPFHYSNHKRIKRVQVGGVLPNEEPSSNIYERPTINNSSGIYQTPILSQTPTLRGTGGHTSDIYEVIPEVTTRGNRLPPYSRPRDPNFQMSADQVQQLQHLLALQRQSNDPSPQYTPFPPNPPYAPPLPRRNQLRNGQRPPLYTAREYGRTYRTSGGGHETDV